MSESVAREIGPFIWATRGRTWGFRFLRTGGVAAPLDTYEEVFSAVGEQPEAFNRIGDKSALRFPDPDGRRDAAGRVIPHEFVLIGSWADDVDCFDAGRELLWSEVADYFGSVWADNQPPGPPS